MTDQKRPALLERMLRHGLNLNVPVKESRDSTNVCRERRRELYGAFTEAEDFRRLVELVTEAEKAFDFVVLVAHKMPRLADALGLDFSGASRALVVSDFALPWIASRLSGANVAIVDDSINMGGTIRNIL
jgi:hypothetical protein